MNKVIDVSLNGHADPFRLHDDAYDLLNGYLEGARSRLRDDPDHAEVIGDLERSIGEKLSARLSVEKRVIAIADVSAVLDEIGAVDTGGSDRTPSVAQRTGRRRLFRVREGQQLAGVCAGLALYSDIDVAWVRTIFVLLAIFTAGVFLLVYVLAMFLLPVVATRQEYFAAQDAPGDAR